MKSSFKITVYFVFTVFAGFQGYAGTATKEFHDDLAEHTCLYETDFTQTGGWTLTSAKIEDGRFQHGGGNWASGNLELKNKNAVGSMVELAGKVTVVYYKMTSDDATGQDQTVVSLVSRRGMDVGAKITYNVKNSLGTAKTQVTGFKDTADYSKFVEIRQVLDARAENLLKMKLDRYDESLSEWITMAEVDIPGYTKSEELGDSTMEKLKVMLRSNDPIEDLAITQSK
jgi:hypothetical protein